MLESMLLHAVKPELEAIRPMKAVFDKSYISNLDGNHVKEPATKWDLAKAVMDDIENFRDANDCCRWCGL